MAGPEVWEDLYLHYPPFVMNTPSLLEIAGDALAKGYRPIPICAQSKVPAVVWNQYRTTAFDSVVVHRLFRDVRGNIALIAEGLVIFDCDDARLADQVIRNSGNTPYQVRTPRGGVHIGYRRPEGAALTNRVRVNNQPLDVRTNGGLALIPRSTTHDGQYSWITGTLPPRDSLPFARVDWIIRQTQRTVMTSIAPITTEDESQLVRRLTAYIDAVPGAVSGQGGHNHTFKLACRLAAMLGDRTDLLWYFLMVFNAKCEPPWSEKELRHKWSEALKYSDRR